MAELEKLLEGLLEDSNTKEKLKSLLPIQSEAQSESALTESFDPDMILKLTKAMSAMGSLKDDSSTRLLCDLKPYISQNRCKRVDEAVQILRLIKVVDIMGKE